MLEARSSSRDKRSSKEWKVSVTVLLMIGWCQNIPLLGQTFLTFRFTGILKKIEVGGGNKDKIKLTKREHRKI